MTFLRSDFGSRGFALSRGEGNIHTLSALGKALGFEVIEVPAVRVDGEPVSSSRIRALLAAGRREEGERLMAFPAEDI